MDNSGTSKIQAHLINSIPADGLYKKLLKVCNVTGGVTLCTFGGLKVYTC